MAAAVREAARVLEPGGRLCACITHPVQTASTWDHEDDDAPLVVSEAYLDKRWMDVAIERDGLAFVFSGWCYPLEAYTRALEDAGCSSRRMREPADPAAGAGRTFRCSSCGERSRRVRRGPPRVGDPHVHVVVVMDERHDDPARPVQVQVRPDEELDGAGRPEAIDEILRQRAIDLRRAHRRERRAVAARVHDVGVEAVLVRVVAEPAITRTERPALRTAEIGDQDRWRVGVRRAELAQSPVEQARCSASVPQRRHARGWGDDAEDRVPGDEVRPRHAGSWTPRSRRPCQGTPTVDRAAGRRAAVPRAPPGGGRAAPAVCAPAGATAIAIAASSSAASAC